MTFWCFFFKWTNNFKKAGHINLTVRMNSVNLLSSHHPVGFDSVWWVGATHLSSGYEMAWMVIYWTHLDIVSIRDMSLSWAKTECCVRWLHLPDTFIPNLSQDPSEFQWEFKVHIPVNLIDCVSDQMSNMTTTHQDFSAPCGDSFSFSFGIFLHEVTHCIYELQ